MVKYYLNKEVFFKSKDTFSCIYHQETGWYYPCNADFWNSLQKYRKGMDVNIKSIPPALGELIQNRFLIKQKRSSPKDFLSFYPLRFPETVSYIEGSESLIAIERKGSHNEIDFDIIRLDSQESDFWELCDGKETLGNLIDTLGLSQKKAIKLIKNWVSIGNQILRLLPIPVTSLSKPPPQLIYRAPFLPKKSGPKESAKDVHRYHLSTIVDGKEQFDRIESTLSHLYREPHPILGDKSYGHALFEKIIEQKEIESGMRILEVGGGIGSISTEIMKNLNKKGILADYLVYDLSPALIRSQKELHNKSNIAIDHINGNAEILALKDSTIDIAISNEVIADFITPEIKTSEVKDFLFDHEIPMSSEFFYFYRDAPEKVRINLGAFMLMKELFRVLKPGGLAIITEFGYQDRLPFKASHLDHDEYSIQFGQLISVSTVIGFNLYLTDAYDFLGFRDDVNLLTGFSYQAVYRIMEYKKRYLPNISYTGELLKKHIGRDIENFRGLSYVKPDKDPFKIVKFMICSKPLEVAKKTEKAGNIR